MKRAVDLDPRNVTARRNLAAVLMDEGQLADAVRHAEEAVRLDPRDAINQELLDDARARLARVSERQGRTIR